MRPIVIFIVGSTGTGKTKLSIEVARRFAGEVVNADAMQMYAGLDIATNKATTPAEQGGIPHHLLGCIPADTAVTVRDYEARALSVIADIHARGKLPVVVGGTHYYVEALMFNNDGVRREAENTGEDSSLPPTAAFALLQSLDPRAAARLHPNDTRKVTRALQLARSAGGPDEAREGGESAAARTLRFPGSCVLWVESELSVLDARLDARLDDMMARGLLQEVADFAAWILRGHAPLAVLDTGELDCTWGILQAIGFKELLPVVLSSAAELPISFDSELAAACVEKAKRNTRRYARHQLAWLRNRFERHVGGFPLPLLRLDSTDPVHWDAAVHEPAMAAVARILSGAEPLPAPSGAPLVNPEQTWARRECELCGGRVFVHKVQWDAHVASRTHRRMVQKAGRAVARAAAAAPLPQSDDDEGH